MQLKTLFLAAGMMVIAFGVGACTSTPESTAGGASGSGVYSEGSALGTDPGSLSVGGAGMGGSGNGGGSGTSFIGSH